MGVGKTIKRWAGIGALAGLLGTAAYGSIDKAYEHLLAEDIKGYGISIQNTNEMKKDLSPDAYKKRIENLEKRRNEAKERLGTYKLLSDTEKKKEAVKDLRRYGGILEKIKDTKAYQPDSIDDFYKLGKGFGYGLVLGGAFGALKGGVRGVRDWRRGRKDEKIRKHLEKENLEKEKGNQNNRRH